MMLITLRFDSPKTLIVIRVPSSESTIFNNAFSPLPNEPTNVFVLMKSSNVASPFSVFCEDLSTMAVAFVVSPIIGLLDKTSKLKLSYKTSMSAALKGATSNINFLVSLRMKYPEVWRVPLT